MGKDTKIAWTKSTFNPWIGCTEVSPGCDHCYARELALRHGWAKWGTGQPRRRTSKANWRLPLRWNEQAPDSEFAGRKGFWPVFCASLADVFDNEVPIIWRHDLWKLILNTQNLTWLLLTKRIGNVRQMWPDGPPRNAWLGCSVVNQLEAERDIKRLRETPATLRFISYEPALEGINWTGLLRGISWLIIGGESGPHARPLDIGGARSTIAQCREANVAVCMKQVGANPIWGNETSSLGRALREGGYTLKNRAGADPSEWPEDVRIRQFPAV